MDRLNMYKLTMVFAEPCRSFAREEMNGARRKPAHAVDLFVENELELIKGGYG
jgi:hypothetical protein